MNNGKAKSFLSTAMLCIPLLLVQGCETMQESLDVILATSGDNSSQSCNGAKATIAIADFENKARYNRSATYALSEKLGQKLLKTGCFQLADRKRMQEIMREHGLAQSGVIQAGTAARFGKLMGVDLLVFGTVTQYSLNPNRDRDSRIEETARIESTISMTDVEQGIVVVSETVSGEALKIRSDSALGFILQTQSTPDKASNKMLDDAVSALVAAIPGGFTGRSVTKAKVKDPNAILAQQVMKEVGTYDGLIDGDLGPKSQAAIRDFQSQFDLSVSGSLDEATLDKMKSMAN